MPCFLKWKLRIRLKRRGHFAVVPPATEQLPAGDADAPASQRPQPKGEGVGGNQGVPQLDHWRGLVLAAPRRPVVHCQGSNGEEDTCLLLVLLVHLHKGQDTTVADQHSEEGDELLEHDLNNLRTLQGLQRRVSPASQR